MTREDSGMAGFMQIFLHQSPGPAPWPHLLQVVTGWLKSWGGGVPLAELTLLKICSPGRSAALWLSSLPVRHREWWRLYCRWDHHPRLEGAGQGGECGSEPCPRARGLRGSVCSYTSWSSGHRGCKALVHTSAASLLEEWKPLFPMEGSGRTSSFWVALTSRSWLQSCWAGSWGLFLGGEAEAVQGLFLGEAPVSSSALEFLWSPGFLPLVLRWSEIAWQGFLVPGTGKHHRQIPSREDATSVPGRGAVRVSPGFSFGLGEVVTWPGRAERWSRIMELRGLWVSGGRRVGEGADGLTDAGRCCPRCSRSVYWLVLMCPDALPSAWRESLNNIIIINNSERERDPNMWRWWLHSRLFQFGETV